MSARERLCLVPRALLLVSNLLCVAAYPVGSQRMDKCLITRETCCQMQHSLSQYADLLKHRLAGVLHSLTLCVVEHWLHVVGSSTEQSNGRGGLGRLWSVQGLPSIMPHGIVEAPHGVDFSQSTGRHPHSDCDDVHADHLPRVAAIAGCPPQWT